MRLSLAVLGLCLIFLSNYKNHSASESITFSSYDPVVETTAEMTEEAELEAAELRRLNAEFDKYKQLAAKYRANKPPTDTSASN